jgi:hypothetical protein
MRNNLPDGAARGVSKRLSGKFQLHSLLTLIRIRCKLRALRDGWDEVLAISEPGSDIVTVELSPQRLLCNLVRLPRRQG